MSTTVKYFFTITKQAGQKPKDTTYVILVDSSPSMESDGPRWVNTQPLVNKLIGELGAQNVVLVPFGIRGVEVPETKLDPSRLYHQNKGCGFGTRIIDAFKDMEGVLASKQLKEHIVFIFVSDGKSDFTESEVKSQLKGRKIAPNAVIDFFSIGIGNQFPTRYATWLKNHYSTDPTTVPLFHVLNDRDSNEYERQFNSLKVYLKASTEIVNVYPPQQTTPFTEATSRMKVGNVFYTIDQKDVKINGVSFKGETKPTQAQIDVMWQMYTNALTTTSLSVSTDETASNAKKALNTLEGVIELLPYYSKSPGVKQLELNMGKIARRDIVPIQLKDDALAVLQSTAAIKEIQEEIAKAVTKTLSTSADVLAVQKLEIEATFTINLSLEAIENWLNKM